MVHIYQNDHIMHVHVYVLKILPKSIHYKYSCLNIFLVAIPPTQPDEPDKRLRGDVRVYKTGYVKKGGAKEISYIPILRPLPPTLFMIMPPLIERPQNSPRPQRPQKA